MIATLNRTVPYFFVLSTLWYETYYRTVPYFSVLVRLVAKRPKAYRTVPPSYRRGTVVRSVRRIVRAQKNHPEGWLIVKFMLVWLQMHFQLSSQPSFVDLSFIKGLKKQIGCSGQWANSGQPVENRTGGTPSDEGQIFLANVVAVEHCLKVGHWMMSSSTASSGLECR